MELLYTRRYKINLFFSLFLSLASSLFTYYVILNKPENITPVAYTVKSAAAIFVFSVSYFILRRKYKKRKNAISAPFPGEWRKILSDMVLFYNVLSDDDKYYFEKKVQIFLYEKRITGIETEVDDNVRLLIAAAAIMPVFKIEDWEYDTISEILVYPDRFDNDYNFKTGDREVLGMVVHHTSSLIISKKDLFRGFRSMSGGNTAVHEFIHVMDEGDGDIDGLPVLMLKKEDLTRWKRIRAKEMDKLESGRSILDPYALTGEAEFLAVAGEYFFKHPDKMKKHSPELYNILKSIFKQDTITAIKSEALGFLIKSKTTKKNNYENTQTRK